MISKDGNRAKADITMAYRKSRRRTRKKSKRRTKKSGRSDGGAALGLIIFGVLIWYFFIRTESPDAPATYSEQVNALAEIEANLKNLELYVADQRLTLQQREKILGQLGEEADEVRLFLETEGPNVQAIFDTQERKHRKERYWEFGAYFVLGIVTSFVSQFLYRFGVYVFKPKKKAEIAA